MIQCSRVRLKEDRICRVGKGSAIKKNRYSLILRFDELIIPV